MRRSLTAILVVGLVSFASRDAAAQPSIGDQAAAGALQGTPVGLIPMAQPTVNAISARFSHYSPKVGDGDNTIAATYAMKAGGNAVVSGTAGYTMVGCPSGATCDNGFMLGGDVHSKLWSNGATGQNSAFGVNLQGSLGYAKAGDISGLSAAVGIPLTWSMEQASKSKVALFATGGFGWGKLKDDASNFDESGTRPYFNVGGAWMAPAGWGIHAGFSKVMIEDGGNNFGVGFSWNLK